MKTNSVKNDKKKRALFLTIGSFVVFISSIIARQMMTYFLAAGIFERGAPATVLLQNIIVIVTIISLLVLPIGAVFLALDLRENVIEKMRKAGRKKKPDQQQGAAEAVHPEGGADKKRK